MLPRPHGLGVVGTFRKKDDPFSSLQEPFQAAERIKAFDWIQAVQWDSPQGLHEFPDERIDKEFLLGNVTHRSADRQGHDGNIRPKLMLRQKDRRSRGRDIFPAFHL